jgi:hypothetical protein
MLIAMLHLEHVVPRKYLVDQLLAAKDDAGVQAVLDTIETCVVLRREHDEIGKALNWLPDPTRPGGWWQRYETIQRVPGPKVKPLQASAHTQMDTVD